MTIIKPIEWATGWIWILQKVSLLFKRRLLIKKNQHKKIVPYDQKKNPYCTVYACFWAYTYNTGKVFTPEYIFEYADRLLKWKWANTARITRQFAKDFWCKYDSVRVLWTDYDRYRKAGYALVFSTQCPPAFWQDGVDDGVVQGIYTIDKTFWHAIYGIEADYDYLVNSWGNYEKDGKHNTYRVDMENMLKEHQVDPYCFLIV
jgi:hypothetical protein